MEGTTDVRTTMRHIAEGYRIEHGEHSLMVTISPSTKHNLLVVRLFRAMRNDPATQADADYQKWGGKDLPSLEVPAPPKVDTAREPNEAFVFVPIAELLDQLPSLKTRKKIAAHDGLACSEAFRVTMQILLRTVFGVRCCSNCPDCSCANEFGCVANAEGGVYGLVEAYFASIECQKTGALHAHILLFIACMHQHMTMEEIAAELQKRTNSLVDLFRQHHDNTCQESYTDAFQEAFRRGLQDDIEDAWHRNNPEEASLLLYGPRGEVDRSLSAEEWMEWHSNDSDQVKALTSHHIHPRNPMTGDREPLPTCLRKGETVCKANCPKEIAMLNEWSVVCHGLAEQFKMRTSGKQNQYGTQKGTRNDPWLNPGQPATFSCARTNTNVINTMRLPVMECTHSYRCTDGRCADFSQKPH